MLTTPQAPTPANEQPMQGAAAPQQQATPAMQPAPSAYPPGYGQGYPAGYTPYAPAPARMTQAESLTPTGAQRLGLAIASLALLIPLLAISIGVITNLLPFVTSGMAITTGLIAAALVCLAVVAVNVIFNWDALSRKQ